jgi:hypothetical protein
MAVAMFVRLPISLATYDRLIANLGPDVNPPPGEILHFAAESAEGVDVCEVWQTHGVAEQFLQSFLEPALHDLGVEDPIYYVIYPLHNLYAADLDMIERIGAVSLPGMAPGAIIR